MTRCYLTKEEFKGGKGVISSNRNTSFILFLIIIFILLMIIKNIYNM